MESAAYYDRRGTVTLASLTFDQAVRMLSRPLHIVVPESEIDRPLSAQRLSTAAFHQTSKADCTTLANPVI